MAEPCTYCLREHGELEPCLGGPCATHKTCPVHTTGIRCVVCVRSIACNCGAADGRACRRPSGHQGPMVKTHADRVRAADAIALARFPAAVRRSIDDDAGNPDALKAWSSNLRKLRTYLERNGDHDSDLLVLAAFERRVQQLLDACADDRTAA